MHYFHRCRNDVTLETKQAKVKYHKEIFYRNYAIGLMNNITGQHYILYPFAKLHKVYDKCSGKGWTDIGRTPLKILYINKTLSL